MDILDIALLFSEHCSSHGANVGVVWIYWISGYRHVVLVNTRSLDRLSDRRETHCSCLLGG